MPIGEPTMPTGEAPTDKIAPQESVGEKPPEADAEAAAESQELDEALQEGQALLSEAESVEAEVRDMEAQLEGTAADAGDPTVTDRLRDLQDQYRDLIDKSQKELMAWVIGASGTMAFMAPMINSPDVKTMAFGLGVSAGAFLLAGARVMISEIEERQLRARMKEL